MKFQDLLLTGALRVFRDFTHSNFYADFEYDFNNSNFEILKDKYNIVQIAGNGDELTKALNLLRWCCDNVLHNGGSKNVESVPKTSIGILDYAYQKGIENGVYCRLQSIVFTECCLALGIKSRILHCLPFSPNDFDSHVVSIVFINSLNKWIMVDAGSNGYFLDENNIILSPMEVRQKLGDNSFVKCNPNIYPNSSQSFEDKQNNYQNYMAKNLFYFKSMLKNTFGADLINNQETIYCIPNGFYVYGREIAYCHYAINNCPEHLADDWKKELSKFIEQKDKNIMSYQQFF